MDDHAPTPREWVKPVEGELWEVFESLDEANLAIAIRLREAAPPDEEARRFTEQFGIIRDWLQKILLDVLSPETKDPDGTDSGLLAIPGLSRQMNQGTWTR